MSDFDNFDDLDAVRDFRSGVGLLTPEVDDRIRRRIIDLAIARGLADGTRYPEPRSTDRPDDDGPGGLVVVDLPAEGDDSLAPAAPVGTGSSDGTAASVVELHAAARPPARPPRVLVAAAAIVVVLLVVTGVVLTRRSSEPNPLDIANPPSPSTSSGVTSTTVVASIDALEAVLLAKEPEPLDGPRAYVRTVDRRTQVVTGGADSEADVPGTFDYTLIQERAQAGFKLFDAQGTFRPANGATPSSSVPKTLKPPSLPFAGRTYGEVEALAGKDVAGLRRTLLEDEGRPTENYQVIVNALNLLRLPITPSAVRSRLVTVLTTSPTYVVDPSSSADGQFFVLVLRNGADETVTIRFDTVSGGVLGWVRTQNGVATDTVEVVEQPVVVRP